MQVWRLILTALVVMLAGGGCAVDSREPSAAVAEAGLESSATDGEEALVVHVVDGDTFDVELSVGTTERVRLPQVDTPELEACGYAESAEALDELVLGATVRLVPTESGPDRDSHGRLLRAAELDGDDVGRVLVRDGLARWVSRYADEDPRLAEIYEEAERRAREEAAGLWSSCRWP
ncbi:MAG TPA: thermonuclease family protein [Polyangiaceae bacterium]|nr:thermonuclease family protein [Polyangiaceae bacterium]